MGAGDTSVPHFKAWETEDPLGLFPSGSAALPTLCSAGSAGRGVRAVPGAAEWLRVGGGQAGSWLVQGGEEVAQGPEWEQGFGSHRKGSQRSCFPEDLALQASWAT